MRTLIQNARRINDGNHLLPCHVLISDGIIQMISETPIDIQQGDVLIDAENALITQGLIDLHVHLREPGFTHKETIASGSRAAAHGGYTTICAMPNTKPAPDTAEKMKEILAIIERDAIVRVLPYAPITIRLNSETVVDMKQLSKIGAVAFTNDGVGVQSAGVMLEAMNQAKKCDVIIVAHTEDNSLLNHGVLHEGFTNKLMGLPGILSACESSQVARDLILAETSGVHYHVCHVSAKESVRLIRDAKYAGIKVSCEVTPHHLLLNETDIVTDDANYKMNPPLRARDDQQALLKGLLDGTIDCIATDHAPHSVEEKKQGIRLAPFGITGLETAFALLYTEFVRKGIFKLDSLIQWMSVRPAELFNLNGGKFTVGQPADLALFDLDIPIKINADQFESKSQNSPFIGREVYGSTVMTLVDGIVVWKRS